MPEEFGLIAMIMVFVGIGHSLATSGMSSSLIRSVDPDQRDYSSVFFINVIASVFIYGFIYAGAPAIARFYEEPLLQDIVRVYSLLIIVQSFVTVQMTRMTKEMNFRVQTIILIPSIVVGGIVGITLALYGWGVWSLVYMALARTVVSTVQYWFYTGWRPDWIIDRERLWYHFNFGYKLTLSGILNAVFNNAYNIIIGKYFSPTLVGLYSKADELQRFPVKTMANALNKVTYPMFSEIQRDDQKLRRVYRKLIQQVMFWVTPVLTVGFILAEPLFRFVLTEKWLPAVPYFQILCFVGLLYPIQAYNLNILNVKGRSDLFLRLEIIKKVVIVIGILIALPFGIYGLLYFQVINAFISFWLNSYYSGRFIDYPALQQVKDIIPIVVQGIGVGALIYFMWYPVIGISTLHDFWEIGVVGLSYVAGYYGISLWFKPPPYHDFREIVLSRLSS